MNKQEFIDMVRHDLSLSLHNNRKDFDISSTCTCFYCDLIEHGFIESSLSVERYPIERLTKQQDIVVTSIFALECDLTDFNLDYSHFAYENYPKSLVYWVNQGYETINKYEQQNIV